MSWMDWEKLPNGHYRNGREFLEIECDGLHVKGHVLGRPFTIPMDVLVALLGDRGMEVTERTAAEQARVTSYHVPIDDPIERAIEGC